MGLCNITLQTFIYFGFFSRPYNHIKGSTFINFWNFFHDLEIFLSLMGLCNITLQILLIQGPNSFWQISQALRLFSTLRLFWTLKYGFLLGSHLSDYECTFVSWQFQVITFWWVYCDDWKFCFKFVPRLELLMVFFFTFQVRKLEGV